MTDEWGPRKGPAKLAPSSTVKRRVWVDVASGSTIVASDHGRGVTVRFRKGFHRLRPGQCLEVEAESQVTGPRGRSWCAIWGAGMVRSLGCPTRQMRRERRHFLGFAAQSGAQVMRRVAHDQGHGPGQPLGDDEILNPRPLATLEAHVKAIRAGMAREDR